MLSHRIRLCLIRREKTAQVTVPVFFSSQQQLIDIALMNEVEKKLPRENTPQKHAAAIKLTTLTQMQARKILRRDLSVVCFIVRLVPAFCCTFSECAEEE
jgi:hypothetical protein